MIQVLWLYVYETIQLVLGVRICALQKIARNMGGPLTTTNHTDTGGYKTRFPSQFFPKLG